MAGTVVETHGRALGGIGVVTLTCTADAADGSFPATALTTKIGGRVVALETNPGSPAPTANYDIVLTDAEGYDVLQGLAANRSATVTEKPPIVYSGTSLHPVVAGEDTLTWTITGNAVNSAVIVGRVFYEGADG